MPHHFCYLDVHHFGDCSLHVSAIATNGEIGGGKLISLLPIPMLKLLQLL